MDRYSWRRPRLCWSRCILNAWLALYLLLRLLSLLKLLILLALRFPGGRLLLLQELFIALFLLRDRGLRLRLGGLRIGCVTTAMCPVMAV